MPWVVKLGSDPDLLTWDTRVLDTLSDLVLVAVRKSGIDVPVAGEESSLDSLADLVWLGLPGTETNSWDLVTLCELSVLRFNGGESLEHSEHTVLRVKVSLVQLVMFAVMCLSGLV